MDGPLGHAVIKALKSISIRPYSTEPQNLNHHPEIHSFRLFLWRLFKSTTTRRRSRHSMDTVSEFHAEASQATASKGLSQGPYVAARAGFEPATFWKQLALNLSLSHHAP